MSVDTSTRILVVDSSASTRQVLGKLLAAQGFSNVDFATDAASAWKKISLGAVDMVICELTIGKLHGLKLLQKLRTSKDHKGLPFMMMAKTRNPKHIVAVVKAGANDFLVKPFDAKTLAAKLDKVLSRKPPAGPPDEKKLLAAGAQLLKQKSLDKAVAVFSKAAKLNPLSADAFKGLAEVCRRRNDVDQFKKMANKAAELCVQTDNYPDAEEIFLDLQKYDKDAPNPFASMGRKLMDNGDGQAAVKAFSKASLLSPEDPAVLSDLAKAYTATGDTEKAAESAKAALLIDDSNPDSRKMFREITGQRWGDAKKAEEKKRQEMVDEEKRGTVRFWVPDLLLDIKGYDHNHTITEMSINALGFDPMDETFKNDQELHFAVVRMKEDKPKPEIKALKAKVLRVDRESVAAKFMDLTEKQATAVHDLITAVQKQQQEEAEERQDKVIKFDIDMLFM